MGTHTLDEWKEVNESIRHWETLFFENVKACFAAIALAVGAAGAAMAWTNVPRGQQRLAIVVFLGLAILVALFAFILVTSQESYLAGFYARRTSLRSAGLSVREPKKAPRSRKTVPVLRIGLGAAIAVSAILMIVVLTDIAGAPLLAGARLNGADLTGVGGLRQGDLVGACGDSTTKLPQSLSIDVCSEPPLRRDGVRSGAR